MVICFLLPIYTKVYYNVAHLNIVNVYKNKEICVKILKRFIGGSILNLHTWHLPGLRYILPIQRISFKKPQVFHSINSYTAGLIQSFHIECKCQIRKNNFLILDISKNCKGLVDHKSIFEGKIPLIFPIKIFYRKILRT